MDKNATVNVVIDTLVNEGGTFNPWTADARTYTSGYQVGIFKSLERQVPVDAFNALEVRDGFQFLRSALAHRDTCGREVSIGTWFNRDDDRVYMDISVWVENEADAILLAMQHNQLSIWDHANGHTIDTSVD